MFGSSRKSRAAGTGEHLGQESDHPGARDSAAEFRRGLEEHLRARAELLGIESREAAAFFARKSVLGLAAAGVTFSCYSLFLVATVSLLGRWLEGTWPRPFEGIGWQVVALSFAALHLPLAFVLFSRLKRKSTAPLFEYTRAEFQKDRQWLDQNQNRSSSESDNSP